MEAPDSARSFRSTEPSTSLRRFNEPCKADKSCASSGGPAGKLVTSGKDTIAIARNADGTIAGPLRFDGGPRQVRHVAAPAAVFQVAGALTLQHYLHTMSAQLEALQRGVQDVKDMLVRAQKGDLYTAQRFVLQQ